MSSHAFFPEHRVETRKKSTSIIASQEFFLNLRFPRLLLLFLFRYMLYFGQTFENVLAFAALQCNWNKILRWLRELSLHCFRPQTLHSKLIQEIDRLVGRAVTRSSLEREV